ncbi:MAG: PHP domain-containing protein [Eubacteriales bacterium]|nr:PHP domain-containing protein [Eubacteriales bacterium]
MSYRYETHLHTSQGSACATSTGAQQARQYAENWYTGIILTDHFYNGNTAADRNLPWPQWVEKFCAGYEQARAEGEKLGLDVFFGWEERFENAEFLIYGLDKTWLLAHPEVIKWQPREMYEQIHAAGGLMVQAHPFRRAWYIKEIQLFPNDVDAVEIVNAANAVTSPGSNAQAIEYAARHGLPGTGGSDAHRDEGYFGGMEFENRLTDIQDYVRAVKAGKGYEVIQREDVDGQV